MKAVDATLREMECFAWLEFSALGWGATELEGIVELGIPGLELGVKRRWCMPILHRIRILVGQSRLRAPEPVGQGI